MASSASLVSEEMFFSLNTLFYTKKIFHSIYNRGRIPYTPTHILVYHFQEQSVYPMHFLIESEINFSLLGARKMEKHLSLSAKHLS